MSAADTSRGVTRDGAHVFPQTLYEIPMWDEWSQFVGGGGRDAVGILPGMPGEVAVGVQAKTSATVGRIGKILRPIRFATGSGFCPSVFGNGGTGTLKKRFSKEVILPIFQKRGECAEKEGIFAEKKDCVQVGNRLS